MLGDESPPAFAASQPAQPIPALPIPAPPADGDQQQPPQQPGILSRTWGSLKDAYAWATAPATEPVGGPGRDFSYGVVQGLREVAEKPILAALNAVGSGDTATAQSNQRTQQFHETFGDSTSANVGRAVGQSIATAPLMMAGGAGITSLAGSAAVKSIPGLSTALNILSGAAGEAGGGSVGNLALRGTSLAAQGALSGGITGALTAGNTLPDITQGALSGAETGAVAGPALAAISYPFRALSGTLPNMMDRARAIVADKATKLGTNLDPTQLTSNPLYKTVADELSRLPGAGVEPSEARPQWQSGLAHLMGEQPAPDGGITRDVMKSAATNIGQGMDDILGRTSIGGQQMTNLHTDLNTIANDLPKYGLAENPAIKGVYQDVADTIAQGNGQIRGPAYQTLTQTDSPIDALANSDDPSVSMFGYRLKGALKNAFGASVAPADAANYAKLQEQYRAMKTVQPLVEQKGATGDIDPNALQTQAIKQSRRFDSSTGGVAYEPTPISDYADVGKTFFGTQPDSRTAERGLSLAAAFGAGAAGGAAGIGGAMKALPFLLLHPLAAAGVAAPFVLNRAVQAGIRSPVVGRNIIQGALDPASRTIAPYIGPGVSAATNLLNLSGPD